jgi:hypothetical protein
MNVKLGRREYDARVLTQIVLYGACHAAAKFHDKAYIFSVWEGLMEQDMIKAGLASFQEALIELNRRQLIQLSRADLVAAMDPDMVHKSRTLHPTGRAEFHFVLVKC